MESRSRARCPRRPGGDTLARVAGAAGFAFAITALLISMRRGLVAARRAYVIRVQLNLLSCNSRFDAPSPAEVRLSLRRRTRNRACSARPSASRTATTSSSSAAAATGWPRRTTWRATTASRDIAVLEKGYIGGGNTGRNTAIIRSNYLTPEGVKFYDESVRLLAGPVAGPRPQPVLFRRAATSRWPTPMRRCAPCAGGPRSTSTSACDSEVVDARRVEAACPHDRPRLRRARADRSARCITRRARSRGTTRWPGATARGADRRGVEIHQKTEVTRHRRRGRRRSPACAPIAGDIATRKVLSAVAGCTPRITDDGRLRTPIYDPSAAGVVTEPLKPWLDPIIVSGQPARVRQPDRARRAGDGRVARSLRAALGALDARLRRGPGRPHARPVSVPVRREGQPAVGRAWRT